MHSWNALVVDFDSHSSALGYIHGVIILMMMPPTQDIEILADSTIIALHTVLFKFSDCLVVPFVAFQQVGLGRELVNDGHPVAIDL